MDCKRRGTPAIEGSERGEERELAIVQFMEVTAVLDAVEKRFGFISVRWSVSDSMPRSVCFKELKHGVSKVGECHGLENSSSLLRSVPF